MPSIEYDFSRTALYTPEKSETLFKVGVAYTDLQIAIECARLAYVQAEHAESEKTRLTQALALIDFYAPSLFVDEATGTEAFATIRHSDHTAIIAFRGTQPGDISDLATNISVSNCEWSESAGRVHSGFANAARSVLPQILQWIEHQQVKQGRLILTGHSLGAAVATLIASIVRPALLVTLGSPRVGDRVFANSLNDVEIRRLVNCCDAVTEVPPELPMYTHVGKMIYINHDGDVVDEPNEAEIKEDRKRARIEYLKQYAWKKGAVLIRDFADHAPINYVRAIF